MVHEFDSLEGFLPKWSVKKLCPIISWDYHRAILGPHQLSVIHDSGVLNHSSYIIEATNFSAAIYLLKQAKTPIWGEFCMPYNQKTQGDALTETDQHPPGEVLDDKTIFILSTTVVCVEEQVCLAEVMGV